jgi:uncharacterized membrane protein
MTAADNERVKRAIDKAEAGTTGKVVVRIVPEAEADALARAKAEFAEAGLHGHEHRNVALILVAPQARSFAIVGDRALHERVGDAFWQDLIAKARPYFARGEIARGIIFATERLGETLRAHFPRTSPG